MPASDFITAQRTAQSEAAPPQREVHADPPRRKPPQRVMVEEATDPLLTVEDVARRLNVSRDWVWDHSSRKTPQLPVIRMGDGALRYRASRIEAFIDERERLSAMRRRA
jgi:predicted DNA-binding transcriptional regulator AlpA